MAVVYWNVSDLGQVSAHEYVRDCDLHLSQDDFIQLSTRFRANANHEWQVVMLYTPFRWLQDELFGLGYHQEYIDRLLFTRNTVELTWDEAHHIRNTAASHLIAWRVYKQTLSGALYAS